MSDKMKAATELLGEMLYNPRSGLQCIRLTESKIVQLIEKFYDLSRFWVNDMTDDFMFDGRIIYAHDVSAAVEIQGWIRSEFKLDCSLPSVKQALATVAGRNRRNPFIEFFETLVWDRQERLEKFGLNVFGSIEEKHALLWRRYALQMCHQVYNRQSAQPKIVPCLRGENNLYKTPFWSALAMKDEWYTSSIPGDLNRNEEVERVLEGRLVACFDEMKHVIKSDQLDAFKNVIGEPKIRYSKKFKDAQNKYRTCVFGGNTNRDEILKDPTGNSRFYMVDVVNPINVPMVRALWPQVLAEAKEHYFRWLEDDEYSYGRPYMTREESDLFEADRLDAFDFGGDEDKVIDYLNQPHIMQEIFEHKCIPSAPMLDAIWGDKGRFNAATLKLIMVTLLGFTKPTRSIYMPQLRRMSKGYRVTVEDSALLEWAMSWGNRDVVLVSAEKAGKIKKAN